jgi:excisionase family DNA binding protein
MQRQTYTVFEAAKVLGIGRGAAYEAARTGTLPTIRVGRRILVPRANLERLLGLERHATSSDEQPLELEKAAPPANADRARMQQRVSLITAPVAVSNALACLPCVRDVDESSGVAGPHNNTGYAPPALTAPRGFRRPDCPSVG